MVEYDTGAMIRFIRVVDRGKKFCSPPPFETVGGAQNLGRFVCCVQSRLVEVLSDRLSGVAGASLREGSGRCSITLLSPICRAMRESERGKNFSMVAERGADQDQIKASETLTL